MREAIRGNSAAAATSALPLELAGQTVHLLAERAVWWPARRTLIVADLHLGKEETFQQSGVPMPRGVTDHSLARLTSLTIAHEAERIVVVGDLVHARRGLTRDLVERVAAWRASFAGVVELSVGNHDRGIDLPPAWNVVVRACERDGPFAFVHDPERAEGIAASDDAYSWCGHLHPTVRLAGPLDRLSLPCFVIGGRRAVLPAFTAFARGPGVKPSAGERVYALAEGEVIEIAGC